MSELHMYTNEFDTVIAYNADDAGEILIELIGISKEDLESSEWIELEDNSKFTLYYDDNPGEDKPPGRRSLKSKNHDMGWMVKATVKEWIEFSGRGFFASTEY